MPLDGAIADIEADFEILEAVGRQLDDMIMGLVSSGALQKTLRRWLFGHAEPPEEEAAQNCLMGMAADLELFTPSASGRTAIDRHLGAARPETRVERQALEALGAAQFRLVRIVSRVDPDLIRLKDVATGESLDLINAHISPQAAGLPSAMRLCRLDSGRHLLISPMFAIDEAMLTAVLALSRPGRPPGHRCAAILYRDVARRGFLPIPRLIADLDQEALLDVMRDIGNGYSAIQRLALEWMQRDSAEDAADLVGTARRLASVDNLVDACGGYGDARAGAPEGLAAAFARIAEAQMETLVQRARAGMDRHAGALDLAAADIARFISQGGMKAAARDLFDRLRARWALSATLEPEANLTADLDRIIQRIQALRAKTVDRGCTEAEAMAAAAKVSELLDRHDLTLDEISIRKSDCEGVSISTGRKRRAPVDSCMRPLAEFCDCRVWSEEADDGALRYVFFGLKADVTAARFLHDLIDVTFKSESAAFRVGDIYMTQRGGDRRSALNSFQVGLAGGVTAKLATLKAGRQSATARSTGFDLVAVKHSMVDEEVSKLGLDFTSGATSSRRYVQSDAYAAGKAAGALFEPNAMLGG